MKADTFTESTERARFSIRLWILPVAGSLVFLVSMGSMRSNSLIYMELIKEGNEGRLMASLPFSLLGVASITMAPVIGFCGPKMTLFHFSLMGLLFLFLGQVACFYSTNLYAVSVFIGYIKNCGVIILWTYVPQVINFVFKDHTTTAMGVATLGEPLGGFLWPYLFQYFLDNYGLKGAFLLSAGVSLHALVGIIVISNYIKDQGASTDKHNNKQEPQSRRAKGKEVIKHHVDTLPDHEFHSDEEPREGCSKEVDLSGSNRESETNKASLTSENIMSPKRILIGVMTSWHIYILSLTHTVTFFGKNALIQVMVDYMNDKGIDRQSSLVMLTVASSGEVIGRLFPGWISDRKLITPELHVSLTLMVSAIALLATTYISNFQIICACYFILGISQASVTVTNWTQYSVYFKDEELLMAYAVYRFFHGFVQLCRTPLIGLFRDVYQSYEYLFRALSLVLFLLSALWALVGYLLKKRIKAYKQLPTDDQPNDTKI